MRGQQVQAAAPARLLQNIKEEVFMAGTWICLIGSLVFFIALGAYKAGKSVFDK